MALPVRRSAEFLRTLRNLVQGGVPETVAMRITGHKTRSVFTRYAIAREADLTKAMRTVEVAALQINKGKKALQG